MTDNDGNDRDDRDDIGSDSWLSNFMETKLRHEQMAARRRDPKYPHTDSCRQKQQEWREALAAYEKAWPNYCRTCWGFGMLGSFDDVENCSDCVEKGLCPRCAAETLTDHSEDVCEACGWDMVDMTDGAPVQPDCDCNEVTKEVTKMADDGVEDIDMDDEEEELDDPNDPNKHRIFSGTYGPYSWCLSCEKAAPTPAFYEAEGCPSCGASPMNQWRWTQLRETNPDYPEVPVEGEVYPLYGKK